jgi:hypothetical protein
MNKMKTFVLSACICVALFPALAAGQCISSQEKPDWTNGYFQEENNSYIEVASATGYTETEARNKAASIIIERRSGATGKRINVQVSGNDVVVSGNDHLTVKSRVVDEYRELCDGQYRVYLLVQTAKNPVYDFERVRVSNEYDFSPRAFVPGMAQLQKGSTGKGIFFIAGEVAFVGGIVIAENLRASYTSKINSTHNAQTKQNYIDKADMYGNIRNAAIAGAVALYAWNVIDGIVAKGKKHVLIGDKPLRITPYLTPGAGGLSLSFNF